MKHSQYAHKPQKYAIASIIIFNKVDIPFNRDSAGGKISDPQEKLDFLKTSINGFLEFDPGVYLENFVIINADTDCNLTKEYYAQIDGTQTKFGTTIKVLNAPDKDYPGPFASRQAVYHAFPGFRYYFTCDADCIPIKDGWYKDGIDVMCKDDQIGLLGAWMTELPYKVKAPHIIYPDLQGNPVEIPHTEGLYYTSGFFSFIRGHIYQLFDQFWGTKWFTQGSCYRDWAIYDGELMFAHRIQQLGYKVADFNDDQTDAPLCWHVPDVLFPNFTIGNKFVDPSKPKISPFFHTYLKMKMPEKWELLTQYAKDHPSE